MSELEAKLKVMTNSARSLNDLLSVIREEDYLIVEHADYGHVTELHAEDFPYHKEVLRDALNLASNGEELPPWE